MTNEIACHYYVIIFMEKYSVQKFKQKAQIRRPLESFHYTENNGACFISIAPSYNMLHSNLDLMVHNIN